MKKRKKAKINRVTKYHLTQLNQSCWLVPCYKLHLQGVLLLYLFHYQINLITWHLGQRKFGMNIKHLLRILTFWENFFSPIPFIPKYSFPIWLVRRAYLFELHKLKGHKFVSHPTPCTILYVNKLTMLYAWALNSRSNSLKPRGMIQPIKTT